MYRERTAAKVLGVILTIVSVGMATLGIVCITCANTIVNGQWFAKTLCDDVTCDYFRSFALEGMDENEFNIDREDIEEAFSDEFIRQLFSDVFTVAFDENADYDLTYYEDYIEDEMIPAVEEIADYRFSASEKREFADETLDMIEEVLEENRGYIGEEGFDLEGLVSGARSGMMIRGIVYFVICAALLGIQAAVYRNKFCVIKNAGLIATISGASTALIGYFLYSAFTMLETDAAFYQGVDGRDSEMFVRHLVYSVEDEVMKHMLIDIAIAVVGIVLIIVGSILMRKFRNKQLADSNATYSNYYGGNYGSTNTYNGYYSNSYGTDNGSFNSNDGMNYSSNQSSSFENATYGSTFNSSTASSDQNTYQNSYNQNSYNQNTYSDSTNSANSFGGNDFSDASDFGSSSNNSFGNPTQSPWASGTNSGAQSPWASGTNSDAQSPWASGTNSDAQSPWANPSSGNNESPWSNQSPWGNQSPWSSGDNGSSNGDDKF